MSFLKILKSDRATGVTNGQEDAVNEHRAIHEAQVAQVAQVAKDSRSPEEVLRNAGYKIKLVTPTSFGTQIDLAKSYNQEEVAKVLQGFTTKFKNKSVFIVN